MTDRMAALATLSLHDVPERAIALADFYKRYSADALIIDKWFSLQAMVPEADTLEKVRGLTGHPAFSLSNPNRVRALIGAFSAGNPDPVQPRRWRRLRFHRRYRAGARSEKSPACRAAGHHLPHLAHAGSRPAAVRRKRAQAHQGGAKSIPRSHRYRRARARRAVITRRHLFTLRIDFVKPSNTGPPPVTR